MSQIYRLIIIQQFIKEMPVITCIMESFWEVETALDEAMAQ